jgi:hypothetical protein
MQCLWIIWFYYNSPKLFHTILLAYYIPNSNNWQQQEISIKKAGEADYLTMKTIKALVSDWKLLECYILLKADIKTLPMEKSIEL